MSLPRTLINFAAFQAGWFACVAGAAHGLPWLGPLLALPVAGWHLANADRPTDELRFMLVATALGMLFDQHEAQLVGGAVGIGQMPAGYRQYQQRPQPWQSVRRSRHARKPTGLERGEID